MQSDSIIFKVTRGTATAMLCALLLAGGGTISYAGLPPMQQSQQNSRTVTGRILDENGQPVAGAGVVEENTLNGVNSGIDGKFELKITGNSNLVISFIGYETVVLATAGKTDFQIRLTPDSKLLDEVVVTALGIKRDAKALGYSVTEVKGSSLIEARENNIMNSLSGKIAGLQVSGSGNGSMGSSRIIIRGNNSLAGSTSLSLSLTACL
ncbi:MAG: carboxypeptidase-like regulatory domain-containing protein [Candidatus Cryptobacteroides sp.]